MAKLRIVEQASEHEDRVNYAIELLDQNPDLTRSELAARLRERFGAGLQAPVLDELIAVAQIDETPPSIAQLTKQRDAWLRERLQDKPLARTKTLQQECVARGWPKPRITRIARLRAEIRAATPNTDPVDNAGPRGWLAQVARDSEAPEDVRDAAHTLLAWDHARA